MTISSGNSRNRGSSSRADDTGTGPGVSHILANETVEVGAQDNHLTSANFHLVGIDNKIGTVGVDLEGLNRSTSTVLRSSRDRIGASGLRREDIVIITSIGVTLAPSVGISIRISSDGSGSTTVADDVVTRERELRSSYNFHHFLCGNRNRGNTNETVHLSGEGIVTNLIQHHGNRRHVLAVNSDTVHIPSVEILG